MGAEMVIVILGFVWGGYMLLKIHRRRQESKDPAAGLMPTPDTKSREMPRMGKPQTITYNQMKALQQCNFEPNKSWCKEEAYLILDAVKYLRAVCRDIGTPDDGPPPLEVQNELLRYILTEQDIRDYVRKWGEDRRVEQFDEFSDDEPVLVANNQFTSVETIARTFLTDDDKATVSED